MSRSRAAYQAPSPAMAKVLREDLVERFAKECPMAVRCFEACIAHLNCPPKHRRFVRTTNLLEPLFGEEKRRMNAAGSLSGEGPVLKLMYSAVIRASDSWRGVKVTDSDHAQLQRLRKQLAEEQRTDNASVVRTGQAEVSREKSLQRS